MVLGKNCQKLNKYLQQIIFEKPYHFFNKKLHKHVASNLQIHINKIIKQILTRMLKHFRIFLFLQMTYPTCYARILQTRRNTDLGNFLHIFCFKN